MWRLRQIPAPSSAPAADAEAGPFGGPAARDALAAQITLADAERPARTLSQIEIVDGDTFDLV